MIIIEQERTFLVNFNNVSQITLAVDKEEKKYAVIAQTIDKEEIVMGIYKTEERAKEVLQEMTERIENWENLKAGQPTGECKYTYEMPED